MSIPIRSRIQLGKHFDDDWTTDQIKNEPMLFNCDLHGALILAGPITREFLQAFINEQELQRSEYHSYVVDTRVHMLMKGWFPCIPGYHHDDVPRSGPNGQPNYTTPEYRSEHVMGLVNGHICPTEFAIGDMPFEVPDGIIYKQWHEDVVHYVNDGRLSAIHAPSGQLVYFNDRTWHQGTRAISDGWRWFGRISWNTHRSKTVTNELRRQVQVYLENPMEGW